MYTQKRSHSSGMQHVQSFATPVITSACIFNLPGQAQGVNVIARASTLSRGRKCDRRCVRQSILKYKLVLSLVQLSTIANYYSLSSTSISSVIVLAVSAHPLLCQCNTNIFEYSNIRHRILDIRIQLLNFLVTNIFDIRIRAIF